jgi:hypothetical protein
VTKKAEPTDQADAFLKVLEKGVKDVLGNKDSQPSERIAAIAAGVKIAMVRFKISGGDEKSFFET